MNKLGVLEGLLFVVGDEGITLQAIMDIMKVSETEAKSLLNELKKRYDSPEYGLRISYLADAFKLTTKKEHKEYYQKLISNPESNELGNAALETLAIIAYNGPITRLEIDELRGVSTSYTLRKLLAKDLVKVCGKSDLPGKPNLYGVTKNFLDFFGLGRIEDLPKVTQDINQRVEDEDLYMTMYKEDKNDK